DLANALLVQSIDCGCCLPLHW
ncbi:hypothetical protein CCACVL1_22576, partial [Corchorus capsularis]